jgi:general secretion pathway protein N
MKASPPFARWMRRRPGVRSAVLALLATAGGTAVGLAATPSALDSNSLQPTIGAPSLEAAPPVFSSPAENPAPPAPRMAVPGVRGPRGNPLWGISLKSLSVTRERPLFVPSRRPPAPPAVAGPPAAMPVKAAPPPEPDQPHLSLVGAIAGEHEGIGIFVDERTRDIVRLKTGENHLGWVLTSVKGREATLSKDRETIQLSLPAPTDTGTAGPPAMPGMPLGMNRPGMLPPGAGPRPNTNHGGIRDEDL